MPPRADSRFEIGLEWRAEQQVLPELARPHAAQASAQFPRDWPRDWPRDATRSARKVGARTKATLLRLLASQDAGLGEVVSFVVFAAVITLTFAL